MALEWLAQLLVKTGVDLGVQAVQKWRLGRFHDLSQGMLATNVTIAVNPGRPVRRQPPHVVLVALEHENGWRQPLYAEPYQELKVRIQRGVYLVSALVLHVPTNPNRRSVLLGLAREKHGIVSDRTRVLRLVPQLPTADAVRAAGLTLPSGEIPFVLARSRPTIPPGTLPSLRRALVGPPSPLPARTVVRHRAASGRTPAPGGRVRVGPRPGSRVPEDLAHTLARITAATPSAEPAADRCEARTKQGEPCSKRAQNHGLCGNHLNRARTGRKVVSHRSGRLITLPPDA